MKIGKTNQFKFGIQEWFLAVVIISSVVLNSCSGCSPSGRQERNKNNQVTKDNVGHSFVSLKKNKDFNKDTEIIPIEEGKNLTPGYNNNQVHPISSADDVAVLSWNLEDFGKSKSDDVINFIANTVNGFDVVAIQEVVAGYGGAQAVALLNDELNRKGSKWDYTVSDPTSGENSYKRERYAFLWKTSRISIVGQPWLEIQYTSEIDREPFFATFKFHDKKFTLVNFHAITKKMQPETEIKYFKNLPSEYPDKNLVFSGDFNCPQSHTVFNPLKKMGYKPIFEGQKTTLKRRAFNNEFLTSEFDNIFYNVQRVNFINSGVIKFYESFDNLSDARIVSDHIPIWFQFSLN
jgi:endonuclease/exonuclease/phosphatase family metal-dependent hydrolase